MKKLVCILIAVLALSLLAFQGFAQEQETLTLQYDDRKELSTLLGTAVDQVVITDQAATSYQVGTQTQDTNVLQYDAATDTLYAVGVGTAKLTVDGTEYAVTVKPAVLSLVMYTGHSVGQGACGTATQSVVVEAGQAYSSYDPKSLDYTQIEGYGLGWGSANRVGAQDLYVSGNGSTQIDAFAAGNKGTRGSGSALAYQWNKLTGEKMWVINVAVAGSCLNEWMPNASWHSDTHSDYYNTAVKIYSYAQTIIANEIAAGHYTLGHMGILYYCGANDKYYPAWSHESIEANYETLWNSFTAALSMDVDGDGADDTLEFMGLVPYWVVSNREKMNFDKSDAHYMASSAEYPHMFIASNMLQQFMFDENLASFPQINYTTQSATVTAPTSVAWVEGESCVMADDKSHPTQVAYNAIGIDTANNLYAWLHGTDRTVTELTLIDQFFNEVTDGLTVKAGEAFLMAPWFAPDYADNLTYTISGNAELVYPLQVVGTAPGTATLTVSQNGKVVKTLTMNVVEGHGTHCVCGGTLEGTAADAHGNCTEGKAWVPLSTEYQRWHEYEKTAGTNDFMKVLTAGSYYLEDDMTWDGAIYVAPGETVNICLNGHTLTTSSRSFNINGTLNICDCEGGGEIYSKYALSAPIAYVGCCGQFNVYGGSFSAVAPNGREYGGIATIGEDQFCCNYSDTRVSGTMRLYGGTMYGSELNCLDGSAGAEGNGGCIKIRTGTSAFYMYGGTLDGGCSVEGTTVGGGVISSVGKVELHGGTICNSTDPIAAVHSKNSNTTLAIKGDVTFKNNAAADIYVGNKTTFTVEAAQTGTIKLAALNTGLEAAVTTVDADIATAFVGAEGYTAVCDNGKVYLVSDADMEGLHIHCICGGKAKGVADHKCVNIVFEAWTGTKLPTAGNYYLTSTISQSSAVRPTQLNLCLNGQTASSSAYLLVFDSSSANVTMQLGDCNEVEGKLQGGTTTGTGSAVYLNTGANGSSKFTMYSGTVVGGTATRGAALAVNSKTSEAYIYGGTIKDGTATNTGGNIYVPNGIFHMYGGTVSGGSAAHGGNIRTDSSAKEVFLLGGTVKNGEATNHGGNINIDSVTGQVKIENLTVSNGLAKLRGGNIYITGAIETTIKNCTISGGVGTTGGNICMYTGANVTLLNTTFANGTAASAYDSYTRDAQGVIALTNPTYANGGNVAHAGSTGSLTITGCTFTGGNGSSTAKDIYASVPAIVDGNTTLSANARFENDLTLGDMTSTQGIYGYVKEDMLITLTGNPNLNWLSLNKNTYLDLSGHTLTAKQIIGSGALNGMDSATDSYTTDNMGRITCPVNKITCTVTGNFKTDITGAVRRYMAIEDSTGYTFHRFYLGITHMSLKPSATGVGYKAVFCGDEMVQQQVIGYGYTLWVGEDGQKLSAGKEETFASGKTVTLRLQNFDIANYGEAQVYGQVYLTLAGGSTITSSTYNYTLRGMVEAIAKDVSGFGAAQLQALQEMIMNNSEATADWDIDSIRNFQ